MRLALRAAGTALALLPGTPTYARSGAVANPPDLATRVDALEHLVHELSDQLAEARKALAARPVAADPPPRIAAAAPATAVTTTPPASATAQAGVTVASDEVAAPRHRPPFAIPNNAMAGITAASSNAPTKPAAQFRIASHTVKVGGYIMLDAIYSRYSGGNPVSTDPAREWLTPSFVPIGGAKSDETHFNARQSRLWITSDGMIGDHVLTSRVELDFETLPGTNDTRTTNPANLSVRRAYFTFDHFLFGQEWTNFQDIRAFPESVNYTGPSAGTVLVRQAQLRYTRGPLSVSVENPETALTGYRTPTRSVTGDSHVPDVTVRYDRALPGGSFLALAGLGRELRSDIPASKDTALAWGVSASGKIMFGRDDIRFQVSGGRGIGRYLLNFTTDGATDATGHIHAIPAVGGFVSFRHFWTDTLRSTVILSGQKVWNDPAFSSPALDRIADGEHLNLVWSPIPNVDLGTELIRQRRVLVNGASGNAERAMSFILYNF